MARAPLIEVFASIQGEGRHVGRPMAFVRVAACPVRCTYCDTPESYAAPPTFPAWVGDERQAVANPVTAEQAAELAAAAAAHSRFGATRMVSLTGGEPLLYPAFVAALGTALRDRGLGVFLETAAVDAAAFRSCVAAIDHASLDYKLPGTVAASGRHGVDPGQLGESCVACVAAAAEHGITIDVKLVLTPAVRSADVAVALQHLHPFRRDLQLVLQPVTPCGAEDYPCPPAQIAALVAQAAAAGFTPRVLPQLHKLLGVP